MIPLDDSKGGDIFIVRGMYPLITPLDRSFSSFMRVSKIILTLRDYGRCSIDENEVHTWSQRRICLNDVQSKT